MKVIVIAAITVDGYIGSLKPGRLILSSKEDIDAVMALRAGCDAILVGAETIRKDNSSLVTRDQLFIQQRQALKKCEDPIKVTLTKSGNISPNSNFIKNGNCKKIIYTSNAIDKEKENSLGKLVTVKRLKEVTAKQVIADLEKEGVKILIVEGGTQILTMFFEENMVDEFRLSIVPFFIGEFAAPRLVDSRSFPFNEKNRMKLVKTKQLGDTAVMYYRSRKS